MLFVENRNEFSLAVEKFTNLTSQEWFENWDAIDFVLRDFLPQLIAVLEKTDPMLHKCVSSAVKFWRRFSIIFGAGLMKNRIQSAFLTSLSIPKEIAGKTKIKIFCFY